MKFDFTEGEWHSARIENHDPQKKPIEYYVCVDNENEIITICDCFGSESNARLIVCAPEMLKALIDLMTSPALASYRSAINNSRYSELIEKATGKKWEEIVK
jgi:hypothetical protein